MKSNEKYFSLAILFSKLTKFFKNIQFQTSSNVLISSNPGGDLNNFNLVDIN